MAKWIDVGQADEVPDGGRLCTRAEDLPVIVFRIGGRLLAIRNTCPHAGLPLDDADLRGTVLTCIFHGYTYNLENGRNVDYPNEEPPVRTYPVREEGGVIQVDVE